MQVASSAALSTQNSALVKEYEAYKRCKELEVAED